MTPGTGDDPTDEPDGRRPMEDGHSGTDTPGPERGVPGERERSDPFESGSEGSPGEESQGRVARGRRQSEPGGPNRPPTGGGSGLLGAGPGRRRILRHLVLIGVAIMFAVAPLALISGAVVPGDAPPPRQGTIDQPDCTSPSASETRPAVAATVERGGEDGQVTVTYDLSGPDAPPGFAISTAATDIDVGEASGFEQTGVDSESYEWTGEARPSVTYTFPRGTASGGLADESPRFAAGADWVLAPLPRTGGQRVGYDVTPNGVVSQAETGIRVAYVGTLRTTNATLGCQTISIHAPPDSDVDSDELSSAVADAAAEYPVGQRRTHVEGVVVPLDGAIGGYAVGNFFTINPESNLSTATIAVHEYVHTRQTAEYAAEMQWFVEGQPAYYMYRLRYDAGGMSTAEYALNMHLFHERAEWGDAFGAETSINHYYRGTATLAALDFRIRVATDGDRSLLDVVQRLETKDGKVTTAEFETVVRNTTGESLDGWIDNHVVDGEPVAVAAPDNGTMSRQSWETLAAYELLTETIPAAIAFYTLFWYGILLSVVRLVSRVGRVLR